MSVIAALIVGFLAGRVGWFALRAMLESDTFLRENYRHHRLPTAGGLVITFALVAVEAFRAVLGAAGVGDARVLTSSRALTIAAVLGFTLLGLADDFGAAGESRGFRGHVRAMQDGYLTTGGLKLLGGGALALVLAGPAGSLGDSAAGGSAVWHLFVDALVVALSANLANLLDRAPGRVIKVSALSFWLVLVGAYVAHTVGVDDPARLAGVAVVLGAALSILVHDLHERVMLGDTGANALGAAVGLSVVLTTSPSTRVIAVVVLVIFNGLSEVVSFSSVIDAVGPLRALDRLGTLAARSGPRRTSSRRDVD